jgi:ribosomal protein S18 acetylase RimI-like enzyme
MIQLVPMTPRELQAFLERSIPEYAAEHVRAGRWRKEDSVERSRAEHEHLLPNGVESPDNYLRTVVDPERGERVGEVWYTLQKQEGWPQLFVYWIGIDENHRRRGYASEVLRKVEEEARRLGASRVALHVFGDNTGARTLYEKLGYSTTNVLMAKPV